MINPLRSESVLRESAVMAGVVAVVVLVVRPRGLLGLKGVAE